MGDCSSAHPMHPALTSCLPQEGPCLEKSSERREQGSRSPHARMASGLTTGRPLTHLACRDAPGPPHNRRLPHPTFKCGLLPAQKGAVTASWWGELLPISCLYSESPEQHTPYRGHCLHLSPTQPFKGDSADTRGLRDHHGRKDQPRGQDALRWL